MSIKLSHIRNLALSLALLAAAGCAHDDLQPAVEDNSADPYMLLRIALPAGSGSTRSNPMGGEEGNGREEGVLKENVIHDINVFFYDDSDAPEDSKGLDAPASTPILFHIYYNRENPADENNTKLDDFTATDRTDGNMLFSSSNYLELKFAVSKDDTRLGAGKKFAAVANVGYLDNISTLGALRDIEFTSRINEKGKVSGNQVENMDYFPMSTAYNKEYTYSGKSTGTNEVTDAKDHFEGTTTMERLYARIDLWYNYATNAGIVKPVDGNSYLGYLKYNVMDGTVDTENMVYLYNVLPVNVMQTPSFLFKKVTDTETTENPVVWYWTTLKSLENSVRWGGKETPSGIPTSSPTDRPTNYVLERHTLDKNHEGTQGDFSTWYGATAKTSVITSIEDNNNGKFDTYYDCEKAKGDNDPDYGCDHISVIGYANENTQAVDCFHSNYLTGLAIRGFYHPENIYSAYNPAAASEGLTKQSEEGISNVIKIFRYSPSTGSVGEYVKRPSESNCLYFSNEQAAKAYKDAHSAENGIITKYDAEINGIYGLGFTCYYNLWLRHYNDVDDKSSDNVISTASDPHAKLPMEYAIVRNNIYRVALSFSGPGDPTPTMREPDTMMARIFVRKWNLRVEENPLEF